jgi:hypothetical protein
MTPEEKAVIQAAIAFRAVPAHREQDMIAARGDLNEALYRLIISCPECNYDRHVCPGDGNPIGHGDTDCGEHDDDGPREDPLSGELIPAGQDAELEHQGREIAEEREHLRKQLEEIGQGTMQEWMRIIDLETPDIALTGQARVRWQDDSGECIVGETQYSEEYGRFRITVHAEDLGPLQPIGPENDPAQIEEMRIECLCTDCQHLAGEPVAGEMRTEHLMHWGDNSRTACGKFSGMVYRYTDDQRKVTCAECLERGNNQPIWVERPLVDVRTGDTIRMPGDPDTEREVEAVVTLPWHVRPPRNDKDRDPEFHPERHRKEWRELRVKFVGSKEAISFKELDMPVEIQTTPSELAAIEAFGGWSNRLRVATNTAPNPPAAPDA